MVAELGEVEEGREVVVEEEEDQDEVGEGVVAVLKVTGLLDWQTIKT